MKISALVIFMAVLVTGAAAPESVLDLNSIISGGTGAGLMGGAYFLIKTIADRTLPSRSDARASTQLVLEGLNNMVKVLQLEKQADAERLVKKQERIDDLEKAADVDYDRIRELRDEILDLQTRLAQKDRHITTLVRELRRLGAQVTGLDLEDIEVTQPVEEVRKIVQRDFSDAPAEPTDTDPATPVR